MCADELTLAEHTYLRQRPLAEIQSQFATLVPSDSAIVLGDEWSVSPASGPCLRRRAELAQGESAFDIQLA